MRGKFRVLRDRFIDNKAAFFLCAALVFGLVILLIDYKTGDLFETDFWDNVLVEAHGMYMDIILFGILLTLYERFTEKRRDILRLREELRDFRRWNSKEATYRKVGIIKRLIDLNTKEFSLSYSALKKADLSDIDLSGISLKCSYLYKANLFNTNLSGANLSGAILVKADLSCANLSGANLTRANLANAEFSVGIEGVSKTANLKGANLSDANLSGANFTGHWYPYSKSKDKDSKFKDLDFSTLKLTGVDLSGAKLQGATIGNLVELKIINILSNNNYKASLSYGGFYVIDTTERRITDEFDSFENTTPPF